MKLKCKKLMKDCNDNKCHYHNPSVDYFRNVNKKNRKYVSKNIWITK